MASIHTYQFQLAYLILAIRRAWVDRRRPATYLIMSRNCAHIMPGGPFEPENFDRRKRQEHGYVVVTYLHSLDCCDKSWNTPSDLCKQSQLPKFASSSSSSWNSHEPATKLNFAVSCARLLDSEHFAGFTGSTWLAQTSSESSMLFKNCNSLHLLM